MNSKIHVYYGDGKGKTTASIGLSVRALGRGYQVIFAQFLKAGETGELSSLAKLDGITILRSGGSPKFSFQMNDEEKQDSLAKNNALFQKATAMAEQVREQPVLLVLDESVGAMSIGLLDESMVLDYLSAHPDFEVVLTGRNPSEGLLELADYASCIEKVKHPYDHGTVAREGIEF